MERYVKVCVETGGYGAGGGTPIGIYASGFSNPNDRQVMYEEATHTHSAAVAFGGVSMYSGKIEGVLRPRQLGTIFNSLFGVATAVSTPDGDAYTVGKPISLVLDLGEEVDTSSSCMHYVGVGINSFTLTAESKEFLKWTADWIAKSVTRTTFTAPTGGADYVAEDPLQWSGCTLSIDGGTSTLTEISSFNMTIESNLNENEFVLGSSSLNGLVRSGLVDISGSMKFTEREYTELMKTTFGTDIASLPATNALGSGNLSFIMNDSSGTLVARVNLPVAIYESTSQDVSGRDEIEKSITYKAINAGNTWITYD